MARFSFGKNWSSFSQQALTKERVESARSGFRSLFDGIDLSNKRFLDIGFGQGLSLHIAAESGANAVGIDLDPANLEAISSTHKFFPNAEAPKVYVASILDEKLPSILPHSQFDIVHSWGVLHHTGNMRLAFLNAMALVKPGGYFVFAIYNRHWTSPLWLGLKHLYNALPEVLQEAWVYSFLPLVRIRSALVAKPVEDVTGRGMEVLHDIRDWLGGLPYEYASIHEMTSLLAEHGFQLEKTIAATGWTGCNQFIARASV